MKRLNSIHYSYQRPNRPAIQYSELAGLWVGNIAVDSIDTITFKHNNEIGLNRER